MFVRVFAARVALASLVAFTLVGPVVGGDQVPFKGDLKGVEQILAPPPVVLLQGVGGGTATQLGRFAYVLDASVDFRNPPPKGTGILTLTAANGDTLVATISGSSKPVVEGVILVEEVAEVISGTGRFAGASGSFSISRMKNQVTGLTIGVFEGTISSPGASKQ
jgi:hypothetical protein